MAPPRFPSVNLDLPPLTSIIPFQLRGLYGSGGFRGGGGCVTCEELTDDGAARRGRVGLVSPLGQDRVPTTAVGLVHSAR